MSKMDQLRALREAKYSQAVTHVRPAAAPKMPAKTAAGPVETEPAAAEPDEKLCGHKAISGRTCTREHGHAAKSHRYS